MTEQIWIIYFDLTRLGFDDKFVNWIKMLYVNAESSLCIYGIIFEPFSIKKSVRQGCPLSMVLFIISQEPFYRMMNRKLLNYGLKLPNGLDLAVLGYADDSTVYVNCDDGIVECFNVIHDFELATSALLNKSKTSIVGLGKWAGKRDWPVSGLRSLQDSCKILGIVYDNDYQKAVKVNWEIIESSITKCIGIFHNRKLTLFQRSIIINCKILAKCWYIAQVFQFPIESAKRIQKTLFKFL